MWGYGGVSWWSRCGARYRKDRGSWGKPRDSRPELGRYSIAEGGRMCRTAAWMGMWVVAIVELQKVGG